MIVKDDLLKVDQRCHQKRSLWAMLQAWFLRPIGQPAGVKQAGNPAYTQLMGATRRLIGNKIAVVPLLSYAIGSWGRGFFTQTTKNFVRKTTTYELATQRWAGEAGDLD